MLEAFVQLLASVSAPVAAVGFFVENLLIIVVSVVVGRAVVRGGARRVTPPPPPLESSELALVASTLLLNTAVTLTGWWLWKEGIVHFRATVDPVRILVDVGVLLLVMDVAMYLLHRIAHHPWLYPWLHAPHHRFVHPRPLTLFALHPAEAVGFGGLWLALVSLYDATWIGMGCYLTLNVVFGLLGHLGVEPLPRGLARVPALRALTTSAFHAGHHVHTHGNYGFYTRVWDRLAGTMLPDDAARFDGLPELNPSQKPAEGAR